VIPCHTAPPHLHSFPTRRSSDLKDCRQPLNTITASLVAWLAGGPVGFRLARCQRTPAHLRTHHLRLDPCMAGQGHSRQHLMLARSEEHTSELQSRENLVCRLLLE